MPGSSGGGRCACAAAPGESGIEALALGAPRRGLEPGAVQPLAQPELQLAGRLLGERDGDNLADIRSSFGDDPHDAADERGGLAGPGGRLDDQRGVEVLGDAPPRVSVGHGVPRSFFR